MNYVGLISSLYPRICRSEGNTLVDPKKVKKYKKGKINIKGKINNIEVMICTLD